jgi:hypothetical protein
MVGRRRVISWGLAQDAQAVGKARELVRKALTEWGVESVQDVVELVVSELVTNAVRHARGPIRLCLTCDGVRLLGAVCDGDRICLLWVAARLMMRADAGWLWSRL